YFVLGDNRNNSTDSRVAEVGNIKRDDIIGRAWLRVWPFDSFGILKHQ
ncbi:MAG: signal peptidase I, partial [Acetatifactor sp.]|nr:signal peptidase I [Acetatifactor sp.]